ncbi:MAG: lipid A biosynthesis lauroyl acyltransferase, partial [Pseudomonas neustonica]
MDHAVFSRTLLHPRYWLLWLGLGVLWLVVQLPYSLLLGLGRLVGKFMYYFMAERREVARINLELCFPHMSQQEREALLRENFASNGIALFEMAMAWWWP